MQSKFWIYQLPVIVATSFADAVVTVVTKNTTYTGFDKMNYFHHFHSCEGSEDTQNIPKLLYYIVKQKLSKKRIDFWVW